MQDDPPDEHRPPRASASPITRRRVIGGVAGGLIASVGSVALPALWRLDSSGSDSRSAFSSVSELLASRQGPRGRGARYRAGPYTYVEAPNDARSFDMQTAGGTKLLLERSDEVWPVEAFGAVAGAWNARAEQLADASGAIAAALRHIAQTGGGTLGFAEGRTYRVDQRIVIRSSGVALLGLGSGARLVGAGRFEVRGQPGYAPGAAPAVAGFKMTGFLMSDRFRGPILEFCTGYELGNLRRDNAAGTWINILHCLDGRIHDCVAANGEATKIGFLVLGGENNIGERCRITGGQWLYGFQIKGGLNNWFRDCSIENVAQIDHGFRIRGDAPWHASRSPGAYPFADGGWNRPDLRRASRQCGFADCTVRNSGGVHFLATEFVDCAFLRCESHGAGSANRPVNALVAYRQPGGQEGQLRIAAFVSSGASDDAVIIKGEARGKPLPGVILEQPAITGAAGHAIACANCAAPRIEAPAIRDCGGDGVSLIDSPQWHLGTPRIGGCARGLHVQRGGLSPVAPGLLDDARLLAGNGSDLDCIVPFSLTQGGGALSVATASTRAVDFPQQFAVPGNEAWRVDLTFETIRDGVATRYGTRLEFASHAGKIELLNANAANGALIYAAEVGRIIFAVADGKVRIGIAPNSSAPMRHSIVAIESTLLTV